MLINAHKLTDIYFYFVASWCTQVNLRVTICLQQWWRYFRYINNNLRSKFLKMDAVYSAMTEKGRAHNALEHYY